MTTAVALLPDRRAQAALAAVMRGRGRAVFCSDGAALLATVGRERPDVVLVALRDLTGAPTAPAIRAVHDGFPTVTIVGYCDTVTAATARDVMLATQAGVGDLVIRGERDELDDLRAVVDGAARGTLGARVVRELADIIPVAVAPLFRYCLTNAQRPLAVDDVADAMAVHRKTLAYRLEQAGLPAPSAMVGWCRLLLTARMMEDPGRSTEQIAAELEFPSGAALRNMLMRYTGLRPRDVRARGGVACVLKALREAVAIARAGVDASPGAPLGASSASHDEPQVGTDPGAELPEPTAEPEEPLRAGWAPELTARMSAPTLPGLRLLRAAAVLWGVAAGIGQWLTDALCAVYA